MMKRGLGMFLVIGCLASYGCDAVLAIGGKNIGISSGRFIYEDHALRAFYNFSLDRVWESAEKALSEMKAEGLEKERRISSGRIVAFIQEEKVVLEFEYIDRERTFVSIRVGIAGNQISSRLINEKIGNNLNP